MEALKRMVEEVLSQNADLKRRVRELEEAVSKQGQAPKEPARAGTQEAPKEQTKEAVQGAPTEPAKEAPKEPAVAAATEPISAAKGPWGRIQIGGALEIEAFSKRDFTGKRRSEFQLTTAEFDFEAAILDWAKAELSFEWDRDQDKVTLNEAFITLGHPNFPLYLKAGRGVAPYGIATGTTVAAKLEDSLTLTGPLTTEIFEIKDDNVLVGYRKWGFHVGAYLYNGTTNDVAGGGKQLNHYGVAVGYELKTDTVSLDVGAEWINSVFDTTGLVDAFPEMQVAGRNYKPGYALHAKFGVWGFSFIAELDAALQHARIIRDEVIYNVKPQAWQFEVGYTTDFFFDTKMYLAVNYSTTAGLLGAFPKNRFLVTAAAWLSDNMRLAAEYGAEKDYSRVQLGTGAHAETWKVRLTYEW